MRQVPRWPDLKHHNNVTTVEYTDGQGYFDIMKVHFGIITPISSLIQNNSVFFHASFKLCHRIALLLVPSGPSHAVEWWSVCAVLQTNASSGSVIISRNINAYVQWALSTQFSSITSYILLTASHQKIWQEIHISKATHVLSYRRWYHAKRDNGELQYTTWWRVHPRS